MFYKVVSAVFLSAAIAQGAGTGKELDPGKVIGGFEDRVDAIFRAEAGKPLIRAKKNPPLKPGRGNYVRGYSYSMVAYAARCLYLNESLDKANAALVENAQHYLDNPKDVNDRDSFHWHASEVMRLLDMYGPDGVAHAGRITEETVALCLKPISMYAEKFSKRFEYEKSKTWHVYESENHHAMSFTTCWQFAKIARNHPDYSTLKYAGMTPAQHYEAWNDYFVEYCRERARKGMFIEMMCGAYNSTLLKGIYNFHDFGEPRVKKAAGLLLDLYFAYWAQEQIGGISGGGKSRVYFEWALNSRPTHHLGWYYFGIGKPHELNGHDLNILLSPYRPPAVVADLALDIEGRGRYEVRQFPRGLGNSGNRNPYRMNGDEGGIQRYSYCDPSFILGTPMVAARSGWAKISSQNRWQGVIFPGKTPSRIVPIPQPRDRKVAFNAFWSVQSKGSLITQKLKKHRGAAEMIVWMSKEGLSEPVDENGIVFVEAEGAYAAIRVVDGGFSFREEKPESKRPAGRTMVLKKEFSPVILEIMAKAEVKDLDAFKAMVRSRKPKIDGSELEYETIYGDVLTLDTSYKKVPTINGEKVNYSPEKVFDSPFLNADYDGGVVTITKGGRKRVLDFSKLEVKDSKP